MSEIQWNNPIEVVGVTTDGKPREAATFVLDGQRFVAFKGVGSYPNVTLVLDDGQTNSGVRVRNVAPTGEGKGDQLFMPRGGDEPIEPGTCTAHGASSRLGLFRWDAEDCCLFYNRERGEWVSSFPDWGDDERLATPADFPPDMPLDQVPAKYRDAVAKLREAARSAPPTDYATSEVQPHHVEYLDRWYPDLAKHGDAIESTVTAMQHDLLKRCETGDVVWGGLGWFVPAGWAGREQ